MSKKKIGTLEFERCLLFCIEGKIKCLIRMYKLKKYIKEYHFSQLIGTLYNREITLNL